MNQASVCIISSGVATITYRSIISSIFILAYQGRYARDLWSPSRFTQQIVCCQVKHKTISFARTILEGTGMVGEADTTLVIISCARPLAGAQTRHSTGAGAIEFDEFVTEIVTRAVRACKQK